MTPSAFPENSSSTSTFISRLPSYKLRRVSAEQEGWQHCGCSSRRSMHPNLASPLIPCLPKKALVPPRYDCSLRLDTVSRITLAIDVCKSFMAVMSRASAATATAAIAMIVESSLSFVAVRIRGDDVMMW